MPLEDQGSSRRVPAAALVWSGIAVAVPAIGALTLPPSLLDPGALLWLLALVPVAQLAYYRGFPGAAVACAGGAVVLVATSVAGVLLDRPTPEILAPVAVAYVVLSAVLGRLAELLHRERATVQDLAFTDLLTRLPNRRHARVFLENEFAAAERGRLLAVVLFDLDEFKQYNDRHGHAAGDDALAAFSEILERNTRKMNLSARFGGEEFLSILAGSDGEGARVFAERVRTSLRDRELPGGSLTVSAGVAFFHPTMHSPDELLAAADHALYQAKRDGRNCVRVYAPPTDGAPEAEEDGVTPRGRTSQITELGYPREAQEVGRTAPPADLLAGRRAGLGENRRVLLVEDDDSVRAIVSSFLHREGFVVSEVGDARAGVAELVTEHDVVITDIRLPGPSGNELVAAVKSRWPATQVIVMTGGRDAEVAAESLNLGADRYLFKPFGMPELRAHLVDSLTKRDRLAREEEERRHLTQKAGERAAQARDAILNGARALVRAVEVRDPYTRGHSHRVALYAREIARSLRADRRRIDIESLRLGCELHDVGKIGVSDVILNKVGRLSPSEFAEVRDHPATGRRILEPLLKDETVLAIVSWHHERWDGSGYPDGRAGSEIPLVARIVGMADALDAMTSTRAYRQALPWDVAVDEILASAGRQFDPDLVPAFESCLDLLYEVYLNARPRGSGAG